MTGDELGDPFLYLEEIDSEPALDWARKRSEKTLEHLSSQGQLEQLQQRALDILDAPDRIAWAVRSGNTAYNFWRDAHNPRGLWRRSSWADYRAGTAQWTVVINLDELSDSEEENWVWAGASVEPNGQSRALIELSRGGSDATVIREFDLSSLTFVGADQSGFAVPESKSSIIWLDIDTVVVGYSGSPDHTTESGYPRVLRRWDRGKPLHTAPVVFSGEQSDVSVSALVDRESGRLVATRSLDFYSTETWTWQHYTDIKGSPSSSQIKKPARVALPPDCSIGLAGKWLLLLPRSAMTANCGAQKARVFEAGSVLALTWQSLLDPAHFVDAVSVPEVQCLVEPTAQSSVVGMAVTSDQVVVCVLEDVQSKLQTFTRPTTQSPHASPIEIFSPCTVSGVPEQCTVDLVATDRRAGDDVLLCISSPLHPPQAAILDRSGEIFVIANSPERFNSAGLHIEQKWATSQDGTQVPYLIIGSSTPAKGLDGEGLTRPTILYGYGGFEIALTPSYAGVRGALWLERGGTYVVAGIRGGAEFGPKWHSTAVKENRHLVYEDFAAVAQNLVEDGVCTRRQLGMHGGSNGGLLMGVMLTRYPELAEAIVCAVPLLDMKRYHRLLAGASWMAEYGDPDSPDWEFIKPFSPYHNIEDARREQYPDCLIMTSTRDDRVHPGHARKMTAALEAAGHRVSYFENFDGGHSGAADNTAEARKSAMMYSFFADRLGLDD